MKVLLDTMFHQQLVQIAAELRKKRMERKYCIWESYVMGVTRNQSVEHGTSVPYVPIMTCVNNAEEGDAIQSTLWLQSIVHKVSIHRTVCTLQTDVHNCH